MTRLTCQRIIYIIRDVSLRAIPGTPGRIPAACVTVPAFTPFPLLIWQLATAGRARPWCGTERHDVTPGFNFVVQHAPTKL
jgi:hypothetical protein